MVSGRGISDLSGPKAGGLDTKSPWAIRLQTFYGVALLLPFLALALGATLKLGATPHDVALAHGGRFMRVYPPFLIRGLVDYGIVILWLLRHRSSRRFEPLLWQAPILYAGVSAVLLGMLVLVHGQAAEFVAEHRGWIALRLAIHLAVGYGYVGLIVLVRDTLRANGYLAEDAGRMDLSDDRELAFSTVNGS